MNTVYCNDHLDTATIATTVTVTVTVTVSIVEVSDTYGSNALKVTEIAFSKRRRP